MKTHLKMHCANARIMLRNQITLCFVSLLIKCAKRFSARVFYGGILSFIRYRHSVRHDTAVDEENIEGKVVVVTGGSSGVGKASAKEFAKRGATVVIGDIDLKNGEITVDEIRKETGNQNVILMKLDLSDMDSVEEFAKKVSLEYPKIKIILNNAGILGTLKENAKTKDGFHIQVAINYMGHFLMTNLLLSNLKAEEKSRVVCMASTLQLLSSFDIDDINMENSRNGFNFGIHHRYINTKFCVSLFSKELAKRVEGTGMTTYSLCPTYVRTNIYSTMPKLWLRIVHSVYWKHFITPEKAASEYVMHCALEKNIENDTGKMFRSRKPFAQANKRLDDELARILWDKSSELVHLEERITKMSIQIPFNNVINNADVVNSTVDETYL